MSIQDNIQTINAAIKDAATKANRHQEDITLLAVSKDQDAQRVLRAYDAGLRNFGENYWQEAQPKMQQLEALNDIIWYYIGHIQSNKAQIIAKQFDWVLSVHNEKIARLLDAGRDIHQPPLNVCISVNLDKEASKSGASMQTVLPLAHYVSTLPRLKLHGLMAIPKRETNPSLQLSSFNRLTTLFRQLNNVLPHTIDTLSMGMSEDFQVAIAAGSTMIRIGQSIFGPRRRSVEP